MGPRCRYDPPGRRFDHRCPGRGFLVGIPGRWVEAGPFCEKRRHRSENLRRLLEAAQELVGLHAGRRLDVLPTAVDEDEARTAVADRGCGQGRDDPPESVTRETIRPLPTAPDPSATAIIGASSSGSIVQWGHPKGRGHAGPSRRRAALPRAGGQRRPDQAVLWTGRGRGRSGPFRPLPNRGSGADPGVGRDDEALRLVEGSTTVG